MTFPVQITCLGLALEADADMHCVAATPDPTNSRQQWQLVYYPEKDAVAMAVQVNGIPYVLSAGEAETYPSLKAMIWDNAFLWRCPNLLDNRGIATVQEPDWCLTWEGDSGWGPGTKVKQDKWWGVDKQVWKITRA